MPFLSASPIVRMTKAFATPYRNTVATARTCYSSKGIIGDDQVGEPEKFGPLAQSIYEAGHHTTFQHAHFQFAIENVSRHFIWSFLHSHPFYNSEQVSQRYVTVKPDTMTVPDLPPRAVALYRATAERQFAAYKRLCEMLVPTVEHEHHKRFPRSARMADKHAKAIQKKAQEMARYVLPVGTHAYLYHTVSAVTLLRYWRAAQQRETPEETRLVVGEMVRQLLEHDSNYQLTLQEPLDPEAFPEESVLGLHPEYLEGSETATFRAEFDGALQGRTSRLIGWQTGGERIVAQAVREVLGLPRARMTDEDAIALALNPARNPLLGESLNLTTHSKISRALFHSQYVFKKSLSHTADSQDQRHRMTPASRPVLAAQLDEHPDFVTPAIFLENEEAMSLYLVTMDSTWHAIAALRRMGVSPEHASYLLPNAVRVRFTESADLLNLRHKCQMRLCYNAQEEIWRAALDEAQQITDVHPLIGRYLLPPCSMRALAKSKPICPEGPRYCGVRVWTLDRSEYERVI